jgi:hypothetical protein
MKQALTTEQVVQLGLQVYEKAGADAAFRELAMRDGTAAVEQLMGSTLPDGVKIRFVENDGAWLTFGLPPARLPDGELSDHELDAVAGGRGEPGGIPNQTTIGNVSALVSTVGL